jgi:transcription antitermination factor NusG
VGDDNGQTWCILRTQSLNTLLLAKALADQGYRAWTPTEVRRLRARRTIPAQDVTVALMPGVVFGEYDRLPDLITLSRAIMPWRQWDAAVRRMVVRGVPHFTALRIGDRYARVADRDLSGLRLAESARLVKVKRETFKPGERVRLIAGAGEGLRGVIVKIGRDFAHVEFNSFAAPWEVAFLLLERDGADLTNKCDPR